MVALPNATEMFRTSRMQACMWVIEPGIVVTRVHGHVDVSAVYWYTTRMDRLLESGARYQTFHDWSAITGFDTDVRRPYRAWAERRSPYLESPHFLVESKVLSMALSVTALVLARPLTVHSAREGFTRALRAAVRKHGASESRIFAVTTSEEDRPHRITG